MSRPRKEHQPLGMGFGEVLTKIADKKRKTQVTPSGVSQQHKIAFLDDLIYMMYQVMLFQAYFTDCTDGDLAKSHLRHAIENSILESSLGFARKLNEFFGSEKEIGVSDYLSLWKEDKWILSRADKELLDDRVMHISLMEAKSGKQDWSKFILTYLPKICDYFKKFCLQLDVEHPEYLSTELREKILLCTNYLNHCLRAMPVDSALMKADGEYIKKEHR